MGTPKTYEEALAALRGHADGCDPHCGCPREVLPVFEAHAALLASVRSVGTAEYERSARDVANSMMVTAHNERDKARDQLMANYNAVADALKWARDLRPVPAQPSRDVVALIARVEELTRDNANLRADALVFREQRDQAVSLRANTNRARGNLFPHEVKEKIAAATAMYRRRCTQLQNQRNDLARMLKDANEKLAESRGQEEAATQTMEAVLDHDRSEMAAVRALVTEFGVLKEGEPLVKACARIRDHFETMCSVACGWAWEQGKLADIPKWFAEALYKAQAEDAKNWCLIYNDAVRYAVEEIEASGRKADFRRSLTVLKSALECRRPA